MQFGGEEGIPLAFFPFLFDGDPVDGVTCAVSGRGAGDMRYGDGNNPARLALYRAVGLDPSRVAAFRQVHSRKVEEATPENIATAIGREADGAYTGSREIALSVTVADCLPVFLYDMRSGARALVHSGWKGTGIALDALNAMAARYGTKPGNVAAVLGPCIQSCCYKVDDGRADAFEAEFGASSVRRDGKGAYLDLQAANVSLLSGAGVKNIAACGDCTFTDARLGSFRRENAGVDGKPYTLMAALLW
jgi:YfiH family protein